MLWCPVSILTFDSGQCFIGSALCPLPFDLSEVYLYNCPFHYQMHIWVGAGAGVRSPSTNLLASDHPFCSKQRQHDSSPYPQSHTVLVCMSELLMVLWNYFIGQSWPLTGAMQTLTPLKLFIDICVSVCVCVICIYKIRWLIEVKIKKG